MAQTKESIDALPIQLDSKMEDSYEQNDNNQLTHLKNKSKKVCFDPRQLIKPFDRVLSLLIEQPDKKKRKATNIPKFIIKVFYRDLPPFPTEHHNQRLNVFAVSLN